MTLPFSQSCENNKDYILAHLLRHYTKPNARVLEIAGGTGQHASYFAQQMPHLIWQSTDVPANVDTLNLRIEAASLPNLPEPLAFDVTQEKFSHSPFDYIFSANSLHIMPQEAVSHFFRHMSYLLAIGGVLCVYGPFKYGGQFTSPSNADFDLWLKSRNAHSGIRDIELVQSYAKKAGLTLLEDNSMPANNQLLSWTKKLD